MKVGFLSIGRSTVDAREVNIALFDNGHSAEMFVTVEPPQIDSALNTMRQACDAIVIDGNVTDFYDAYKDTLVNRSDHFELDGKLHSVTRAVTAEYLNDRFMPLINKKGKKRYGIIVFKTYGKSLDELKTLLKDYTTKKSKVQLGFFPDFLECEIHARFNAAMAKEDMNDLSIKLNELLYGCTYSYERMTIAGRVAQMLKEEGLKIKIAESFTGGALASAFTSMPGASEYFAEGLVTYTVAAKNKRLGVPLEVIAEKGVVSGDTAYNMALGLMKSGECDIAVATTGNAGPTAQSGAVGLCYIAIGLRAEKSVAVVKYTFDGDRDYNIRCGVKNAMFLLYESLVSYRAQKSNVAAKMQQVAGAYGDPTEQNG